MSILMSEFLRLMAHAWEASSMYLTVQTEDLDSMMGVGFGNGLGMSGLRRAPLNFIMKKKQPRKTPEERNQAGFSQLILLLNR